MADCSTVEEALFADQLGFDFIGTTLVGYTDQSKSLKIESNDFEIIRQIVAKVKHRVIAEGNINTPEKARRVIELGPSAWWWFHYHQTPADYKVLCRGAGLVQTC